ncbi:MAG: hypothetical protein IJ714_11140 [Bacteroidales bacterium]|nr:hypothetical protein [Bacteroidales bacterium]
MQKSTLRRKTLLEILEQKAIFSQEQLQEQLHLKGIETTQATLSRDLKALQVVKTPSEGYRLPQQKTGLAPQANGILSIEFSGQNAVVKTQPGFAPAVAARIDRRPCVSIMGTLAGDDTILLVLREGFSPDDVLANLKTIIPDIITYRI